MVAASEPPRRVLRPHRGPQTAFLSSAADIAVYGGSAGGGKSYALLLEGVRHVQKPLFRAIYFRRTYADLKKPKSLWDASGQVFPAAGGQRNEVDLRWTFPSGAWVKFNHLQRDSDKEDHQGAEYPLICFDEATHFSAEVFWYVLSRNRAPRELGVRPYVRCTCNPDPDSFLAPMLEWWLDEEGFPIPARSGVLRYFVRDENNDQLVWGSSPGELERARPDLFKVMSAAARAKSFTFIPSKLDDNPSLGDDYRAMLMQLPLVERARLLYGNWRVRERGGSVFRAEWYELVDKEESGDARRVRFWDLAGSTRRRSDCTAGVLMARAEGRSPLVEDVINVRKSAGQVDDLIDSTAARDGTRTEIWVEEERGAAGQIVVANVQKRLGPRGFTVRGARLDGDVLVRAKPVSSASEIGHREGTPIRILRGEWNQAFLQQLQEFPDGLQDDMADAFIGAWHCVHQAQFAWASGRW